MREEYESSSETVVMRYGKAIPSQPPKKEKKPKMHVELKHTLAINANSWYVRLYRGVYDEYPKSFCKLFWGFAGMPLVLLVLGVITPVVALKDAGHEFELNRKQKRLEKEAKEKRTPKPYVPPKPPREPSHWQLTIVHSLENFGVNTVNTVKAVGHILSPVWAITRSEFFGKALLGIGATLAVGIVSGSIFAIVHFWDTTQWVVYGTLAISAIVLILYFLIVKGILAIAQALKNTLPFWQKVDRAIIKVSIFLHLPTLGRGIEKTGLGFKQAMKIGYIAVKSNTCPKIEIIKDQS